MRLTTNLSVQVVFTADIDDSGRAGIIDQYVKNCFRETVLCAVGQQTQELGEYELQSS